MTTKLFLFGTPRLEQKGRLVKLGQKPLLLLAYLALEGKATRRDLARLLWSNATDPLNSVSAARISIRDGLKKGLGGDHETLFLEPGFWCDVLEFEQAVGSGEAHWQAGLELQHEELLAGVRLPEWQDGFGADFEEWLLGKREGLLEQRAELQWRLAVVALQKSNWALALPLLEATQLPHLPLREDAARLLMLCAGALGREVRAMTAFGKLEQRLRDELGVLPSGATRTALETARSSQKDCMRQLEQEFLVVRKPPTLEEVDVPLFGREPELARIAAELGLAQAGQSRLVLIGGEPGVGKSRLARESVRGLRQALVLSGVASPTGVSLHLFERLVRRAYAQRSGLALNPVWQQSLAAFMPDVLGASPLETNKEHLFAAIAALLEMPEQITVLLLDDLHWADATSLELLLYLLKQPRRTGLLVLATQRSTEKSISQHLIQMLAREHNGIRLELRGLDEAAIRGLTHSLGRNFDVLQLQQKSGGNPFYLLEMLKSGLDAPRLRDLILARVEQLPSVAQQLLEVAALLGDGQSLKILRAVSGRSLEEISAALDALALADLLHVTEDGTHFQHDLTREVIAREIRSDRQQILHLRAARVLPPQQAAVHAWAAQDAWAETDATNAVQTFLESGKQNSLRGDLPMALTWFERAYNASQTDADRLYSQTERAAALERYGKHREALEILNRADIVLQNVADPVRRAGAWLARANLLALKLHQLEPAKILLEQSLTALQPLTHGAAQLLKSDALNIQGTIARLEQHYDEAVALFTQSLTIRQALGDDARTAYSLMNLALLYSRLDDPRAEPQHVQALELYRQLGDQHGVVRVLNNLGNHFVKKQHYQRAVESYREGLQLLIEPWAEARAHLNLGAALFYLGDYQNAQQNYTLAWQRAVLLEDTESSFFALLNLIEVSLKVKDFPSAKKHLETIQPYLEQAVFAPHRPEILRFSQTIEGVLYEKNLG